MWKMVCRHVSHGILHQAQRFVADLSFVLVSWGYLKMAVAGGITPSQITMSSGKLLIKEWFIT